MIMLTKEQLADLLRESYARGAEDCSLRNHPALWCGSENYHDARESAIQPLVHRSSGGHDDHGREVK